jgi:hypothetical protein
MDQAPLLRGVHAKFHKMELPPNLTVQKIPYIPYQRYEPASAGNLPIPTKLPVNRWDTTLTVIHARNAKIDMIQIISLKMICIHFCMKLKKMGHSERTQMKKRFLDLIDPMAEKLLI